MNDYFRNLASSFSDSPAEERKRPAADKQANAGRYSSPAPRASPGYRERERERERDRDRDQRDFAHQPTAHPAASAASRSHMQPPPSYRHDPVQAPRSPQPRASAAAASSSAHWQHASVDVLRAEHAKRDHDFSVMQSRLSHCIDSGDEQGAASAAVTVAREKKAKDELQQLLNFRVKRADAERKIHERIRTKFAGEKQQVVEHRRQVDRLKQRLRLAFAVPGASLPASQSTSPSSGGSSRASPPPAAAAASTSSSPLPNDSSIFDMLPRLRQDCARHQVALEHQCLQVDSVELQSVIESAQLTAAEMSNDSSSHMDHDASHASSHFSPSSASSASPVQWSDDLTSFFKSSRKDVVTTLQAVLAEVDGLTQHIKQTEAFMLYLQPPPAASAGQADAQAMQH